MNGYPARSKSGELSIIPYEVNIGGFSFHSHKVSFLLHTLYNYIKVHIVLDRSTDTMFSYAATYSFRFEKSRNQVYILFVSIYTNFMNKLKPKPKLKAKPNVEIL